MTRPEWIGYDPDRDYQVYNDKVQTTIHRSCFFPRMMEGVLEEYMSDSRKTLDGIYLVNKCVLPWEFME